MAEGGEDGDRRAGEGEEGEQQEPQWREYLNAEESRELDNALFFEYEFSIDQLMEIAGLCVAQVQRGGNVVCVGNPSSLFPPRVWDMVKGYIYASAIETWRC